VDRRRPRRRRRPARAWLSFAAGLEHDLDAVTRDLTTHWSSGPIESRVNHIKMVKRQMCGRAGLPPLRKRVLLTASGR